MLQSIFRNLLCVPALDLDTVTCVRPVKTWTPTLPHRVLSFHSAAPPDTDQEGSTQRR